VARGRDARETASSTPYRAQALEPKLSRFDLLFATNARPHAQHRADGSSVGRAVIGAPSRSTRARIRCGHGDRQEAVGRQHRDRRRRDQQSLTIPKLEDAPPGAEPPSAGTTPAASGAPASPPPRDELGSKADPYFMYLAAASRWRSRPAQARRAGGLEETRTTTARASTTPTPKRAAIRR